jgi:transposase
MGSSAILVKKLMENDILSINIVSSQIDSICPCCSKKSGRVHSRYRRTLNDLPILDKKVNLKLCTRKFFCDNEKCDRVIFTERYTKLIKAYARKTDRLNKLLESISFATSAETASKIANISITNLSPDTILRIIKRTEIIPGTDYECIGIDDWAFRKGNKYGTLICDLKTHKPIAALRDHNYDTVAN